MLRLGNVPNGAEMKLAVLDSESGTFHYDDQFNFRREIGIDMDEAREKIAKLPSPIVSLGVDSYSIFDRSTKKKWNDLYLKRLITSSGHHKEFYVLQPNDHQNLNQERDLFIQTLLESNLNVFMTAEIKNDWEGLKVLGVTGDLPERFEHIFDTVIGISERGRDLVGYKAKVLKDRSHILEANKVYDWNSEEQAYDLMKRFDLTVLNPGAKKAEAPAAAVTIAEDKPAQEQVVTPAAPAAPAEVKTDTQALLTEVVSLKKQLGINDKEKWTKMLNDVDPKAASAKEFSPEQLQKFVGDLKALLPS
jgi:hypothetical protein